MNRRNFLTSATVSVGALGLTTQIKTTSVAGRVNEMERIGHKFKFSLAAYSYRDLLSGDSPKLTLKDFVNDCAKFGLEGTELTSYYFPKNPTDEFIYDLNAYAFRRGLDVFGPEGELLDTVELEAGSAVNFQIQGDKIVSDRPGYPAVPRTHSARNIGSDTFREVLIEFKS